MRIFTIRRIVNVVVVITTVVFLALLMRSVYSQRDLIPSAWGWLPLGGLTFLLLHTCKFIRLYFLLNESHINAGNLLKIYLQCTIVNLLIPFKLGELYRWYRIGNTIKDYKTAVLSLITERFFDISVVLGIMIVGVLFFDLPINSTIVIFALITLSALLCYNGFSVTYRYLNSYFVTKRTSSKDIVALRALETGEEWNRHQKKITQNKSVMIFTLSIIIWLLEFITLLCVALSCRSEFGISEFAAYISMNVGIDMGSASIFSYYVLFSLLLSILALFVSLAVQWMLRQKAGTRSGKIKNRDRCNNE